ncbi:MAG: hypothetical protein KDC12_14550 [Flavobacteriales bacterium]|nr:hypothetical protein [Flavobacteriales bacterium]
MARLNTFVAGVLIGLVGFVLGFILLGLIWAQVENSTFSFFFYEGFIKAPMYKVKILSASSILDVILFYIAFQRGFIELCKGIMAVLLLTLVAIMVFY